MAYTFSASGLPPGLSLVGSTIQGTPTAPGAYSVTLSVSDGVSTVSETAVFTIGVATIPIPIYQLSQSAESGSVWRESLHPIFTALAESGSFWQENAIIVPTITALTGSFWGDQALALVAISGSQWGDYPLLRSLLSAASGAFWLDQATVAGSIAVDLLRLPFDGANGSTSFTDTSHPARAITVFGAAQISTLQSASGGSSLFLDGNSAYLEFDWTTPLLGDFTISVDLRPTAHSDSAEIFCITSAANATNLLLELDIDNANTVRFSLRSDSGFSYFDLNSAAIPALDAWTNLQAIVLGDTATLKINGTTSGSATLAAGTRQQGFTIARIGHLINSGALRNFYGWMDNFTITTP